MPRDPEVVHAYYVHPVDYWVARPVEIQTRVIEVDHITEVTRVGKFRSGTKARESGKSRQSK